MVLTQALDIAECDNLWSVDISGFLNSFLNACSMVKPLITTDGFGSLAVAIIAFLKSTALLSVLRCG